MSPFILTAIALVIAPFIGSFLSVLVVRLPLEEDFIWGRSRCRSCSKPLGPAELVPLVSWVVQDGKCTSCGAAIGALYPGMELGATMVALWAVMTVTPEVLIVTVCLGWALLALAVMDARFFYLSDLLTLPLIPAGLAVTWWLAPDDVINHVVGTSAAFLLMGSLAWAYRRIRGRDGLGFGDVKFMAAAGAWLGVAALGSVLLLAVCVSVLLLLAGRLSGQRIDGTTPVPFGTGIAAGLWLTWLYGPISFTV